MGCEGVKSSAPTWTNLCEKWDKRRVQVTAEFCEQNSLRAALAPIRAGDPVGEPVAV